MICKIKPTIKKTNPMKNKYNIFLASFGLSLVVSHQKKSTNLRFLIFMILRSSPGHKIRTTPIMSSTKPKIIRDIAHHKIGQYHALIKNNSSV